MNRRAVSLLELLVASSMFAIISLVTFLAYNHARQTIFRSSARTDALQVERKALQRISSLLTSAYIPPLSLVNTCLEKPNAPYPSGSDPANPLAQSGSGCDSIIFYAPCDLILEASGLAPVTAQTHPYTSSEGPKLYELRLDAAYQLDEEATYQADQPATGGQAPLLRKRLYLREMYIPDHALAYSSIAYLQYQGNNSQDPQPSSGPAPSTPTCLLASGLSDVRFRMSPQGTGLEVAVYAQDREATLNNAQAKNIRTGCLSSSIYFVAGH